MANRQLSTVLYHLRQMIGGAGAAEATDSQLVRRFVTQQDEQAFRALLERYGPMVMGICRRTLSNPHDADDAFQATFLLLVRKAASLRDQDLVGNWLYGVACRVARRARLQAARRTVPTPEVPDMATAQPQSEGEWHEVRPLLDEELQRLPRKYRVPLVLCYLEGQTNEAAARQLRCPTGTIKTRLAKGRELLRVQLARRGMSLSVSSVAAALTPRVLDAAVAPALAEATVHAAVQCAASETLAVGAVSASVASLMEGAAREMFVARLRAVALVCLAVVLLGTGAGLLTLHTLARNQSTASAADNQPPAEPAPQINDDGLAASVDQQLHEWQPKPGERRFDEIGWARDLRQARSLARQHNRLIVLLTYGGAIETARCPASAFQIRSSALSHERVIALLNSYFVPVYLSNADYVENGKASQEEKAELRRIRAEGAELELGARANMAWILNAEGRPVDSLDGCHGAANNVVPLLEKHICEQSLTSGPPVVKPAAQSRRPHAEPGDLVLHLTARYLERDGDELVPLRVELGKSNNYFMKACPAENWLVLDRSHGNKLMPSGTVQLGSSWELDRAVLTPLLQCMYPPTEDNDVARNRIDECALTATVVAIQGAVARARIEGSLTMKHRFAPERDDNRFVDARLVGYIDFEVNRSAVRALRLVTTDAMYGKSPFGVAVRSVP